MTTQTKNRGIATVIVMTAVATVAIVAWAMLSASQISSQVGRNSSSSRQSYYAAESGVSLGLYYLRYPDRAPVSAIDSAGYSYYPGQTKVDVLSNGSPVNIVVTPLGNNKYKVSSSPTDSSVANAQSSAVVEVSRSTNLVEHGLMSNGKLDLPTNVVISGTVAAIGEITAGVGQLLGSVLNISSSNSGSGSTNNKIVPTLSSLSLYKETGIRPSGASMSQRSYTYRGKTYWADLAPSTITGTLKANATTNPCNVWYSNDEVTLNGVTLNGTIITRGSDLKITGTTTITPVSGGGVVNASEALNREPGRSRHPCRPCRREARDRDCGGLLRR